MDKINKYIYTCKNGQTRNRETPVIKSTITPTDIFGRSLFSDTSLNVPEERIQFRTKSDRPVTGDPNLISELESAGSRSKIRAAAASTTIDPAEQTRYYWFPGYSIAANKSFATNGCGLRRGVDVDTRIFMIGGVSYCFAVVRVTVGPGETRSNGHECEPRVLKDINNYLNALPLSVRKYIRQ